jgi:hypothetical protein
MIERLHVSWLPPTLILLGAALRFHAFLGNPSLSIDEAAIARNLGTLPWTHLFGPLDYAQIAPPGFLLLEKAATTIFTQSEYALRAVPLMFGLLSLWLCWNVAKRILSPGAAVCALALATLNTTLIVYSVTAKQYSAEVAAALFVVFLAVQLRDGEPQPLRSFGLGLAGAATVLFSFTAVFMLAAAAAVGLALSIVGGPSRALRSAFLVVAVIWCAAAVLGVWIGRAAMTAEEATYMRWFWASGFMPLPPRTVREALWIWQQLKSLFGQTGHYRISILWVALACLGVWSLRRRRPFAAALFVAPLLLVIVASATRTYPFASGRVQLFLLPFALMLAAEGAASAWPVFRRRLPVVGTLAITVLMLLAVYSTATRAGLDRREEIRPFLDRAAAEWRTGDSLYVYHSLGQSFLYYAPRYRFAAADYVLGTCSRGSGRTYLRELDRLRGRSRVWIALPRDVDIETDLFVRYLDAVGHRLDAGYGTEDDRVSIVVGYLYDLSRSEPNRSISADSFELPKDLANPAPYPWSCYGVFQPEARDARTASH